MDRNKGAFLCIGAFQMSGLLGKFLLLQLSWGVGKNRPLFPQSPVSASRSYTDFPRDWHSCLCQAPEIHFALLCPVKQPYCSLCTWKILSSPIWPISGVQTSFTAITCLFSYLFVFLLNVWVSSPPPLSHPLSRCAPAEWVSTRHLRHAQLPSTLRPHHCCSTLLGALPRHCPQGWLLFRNVAFSGRASLRAPCRPLCLWPYTLGISIMFNFGVESGQFTSRRSTQWAPATWVTTEEAGSACLIHWPPDLAVVSGQFQGVLICSSSNPFRDLHACKWLLVFSPLLSS